MFCHELIDIISSRLKVLILYVIKIIFSISLFGS